MPLNINEFSANFRGGGARATLFEVQLTNPVDGSADSNSLIPFHVKAAQLPEFTTRELILPYMGREVYVSGHRTFQPWTVTVLNDANFSVRNALETWQNYLNTLQGNIRNFGDVGDEAYKSVARVIQYSKRGDAIREYSLFGLWPVSVGSIALSWETDAIQEYEVTFRFDYFEVTSGSTGNAGGN